MADFSRLLFVDLPAATQLPIYSIHVSFKVISLEVSFLLTVVTLQYIFYDRILAIYYCMVVSHLVNGLIAIFYWLIDWLIDSCLDLLAGVGTKWGHGREGRLAGCSCCCRGSSFCWYIQARDHPAIPYIEKIFVRKLINC